MRSVRGERLKRAAAALSVALVLLAAAGCGLTGSQTGGGSSIMSSPLTSAPGVAASVDYEYYGVKGNTNYELASSMEKNGPNGYWAYTVWRVDWKYPFSQGSGGYTTGPVEVKVAVTITLPKWDPPADASPELVKKWDSLVSALRTHEEGHRDIGVAAGQRIVKALEALPPSPSREALEQSADQVASGMIEDGQSQDASYDASTGHGESQGATFF